MHSALWKDRRGHFTVAGRAKVEFLDMPALRDFHTSGYLLAV